MKTKHKIIIAATILAIIAGFCIFVSTLRITVAYTDDNGKPTNEDELGTFTVTFTGSKRYSAEEIEKFFFKSGSDKNPVVFIINQKFGDKMEIPFVETYDMEILSLTDYKITIYDKSVVGYVEYMGSNMYLDKDGIVVESSTKILEDVPLISGIDYDYIVLHQKLPVENPEIFTVLLDVTQQIEKHNINTEKINISKELEIEISIGNVIVQLGLDENLNEKMQDLADIIPNLLDVSGILNMKEYNVLNTGYTFVKTDK